MLKKFFAKGKSCYRQALFPYTEASVKKRFIFLHIPKAAGTAVRVALGEPETGRQHLPWWVYQQASPKRFQEFYKFAFVRDPIDRTFSGYKYLKSGGNRMGDLEVAKYLEKYESFNHFVESEILNGSMIYHPIFRPQSWYLCDWRGKIQVDYIGNFDTIAKDFEYVARCLELKDFKGLPVVNKTSAAPEMIEEKVEKILREAYRDDYNILDCLG